MVNDPFHDNDPGDERWIVVQKHRSGVPKLCKSLLGMGITPEQIISARFMPEFGVFSDVESARDYLNSLDIELRSSFEVRRILIYIDPEQIN